MSFAIEREESGSGRVEKSKKEKTLFGNINE